MLPFGCLLKSSRILKHERIRKDAFMQSCFVLHGRVIITRDTPLDLRM